MTDVIYSIHIKCRWLSWTPMSTACASARGGRWSQSAPLSTARCPRLVPRLEEGGWVSLPRCPRLVRRLEEGGRVSLPAWTCHCSGYCPIIRQELWKEIWFWQRFQYTSVIHVHHRVFYEVSQTYNLTQCHAVSAEWETNKHSSELISGVITMRRLDTLDLS